MNYAFSTFTACCSYTLINNSLLMLALSNLARSVREPILHLCQIDAISCCEIIFGDIKVYGRTSLRHAATKTAQRRLSLESPDKNETSNNKILAADTIAISSHTCRNTERDLRINISISAVAG
jgi:hypothetical protein